MTSGGESPGLHGYPDLAQPQDRVPQTYRRLWTQLLVTTPRKSRAAYSALRGVHAITRRRG